MKATTHPFGDLDIRLPRRLKYFLPWLPFGIPACPMCAGGSDTSESTVYILMGFIALTYIPMFIIYKTIIKNRNTNNKHAKG